MACNPGFSRILVTPNISVSSSLISLIYFLGFVDRHEIKLGTNVKKSVGQEGSITLDPRKKPPGQPEYLIF